MCVDVLNTPPMGQTVPLALGVPWWASGDDGGCTLLIKHGVRGWEVCRGEEAAHFNRMERGSAVLCARGCLCL